MLISQLGVIRKKASLEDSADWYRQRSDRQEASVLKSKNAFAHSSFR